MRARARAAPAQTRARAPGRMPAGGSGRAPPLTKAGHEAFRVEKFGRPMHAAEVDRGGSRPASSQEGDEGDEGDPGADDEGDLTPDCSRVILHFDAGEFVREGARCRVRAPSAQPHPCALLPLPAPRQTAFTPKSKSFATRRCARSRSGSAKSTWWSRPTTRRARRA